MTPSAARVREAAHATHVGRVRDANEDRLLVRPPLLAVADGVGGALAGGQAAQMVVDAAAALDEDPSIDEVRGALDGANTGVRAAIASTPEFGGMGSTATIAVVRDRSLDVVHVGDSRAYLLRDGSLRRITDDHSLVGELMRAGALTPEEAAVHPRRNVITKAVGAEAEIDPDTATVPTETDDIVLLCSDGLTGQVAEAAIGGLVTSASSLAAAAELLVDLANDAGGVDNISVVLARLA